MRCLIELQFLPGQWLDVHLPTLSKAGGFTITSSPSKAQIQTAPSAPRQRSPAPSPYLELAVQRSPTNPAAAWLWKPFPEILGKELQVRVGGSFVWPPPNIDVIKLARVVFIAGGVGINPLISILSHLAEAEKVPFYISFIYSFRHSGEGSNEKILFEERLMEIFDKKNIVGELIIHRTSGEAKSVNGKELRANEKAVYRDWRVGKDDILKALGPVDDRGSALCYICGVPTMTDHFVEIAANAEGMHRDRVLLERWW